MQCSDFGSNDFSLATMLLPQATDLSTKSRTLPELLFCLSRGVHLQDEAVIVFLWADASILRCLLYL